MLHRDVILADRHAVHSWEVADNTALLALTPTILDIGKIARQLSPLSFFLLADDVGPVWSQIDIAAPSYPVTSVNGEVGAVVLSAADVGAITGAEASALIAVAPINDQVGIIYTLVLADAGKYARLNNAAAITLTVPENATEAFPVGTIVNLRQVGVGQVSIVGAGAVTIATAETLLLRKQGSSASLIKTATDAWDLMGDLELAP